MNKTDRLPKLPKSANEILELMQNQKNWTQDELEKNLPNFLPDEIKYALRRLYELGIIVKIPNLSDMRRVFYSIEADRKHDSNEGVHRWENEGGAIAYNKHPNN